MQSPQSGQPNTNASNTTHETPPRSNNCEVHPLRARRFPTPRNRLLRSPPLSRRTTEMHDLTLQSTDSINAENALGQLFMNPSSPSTTTMDPFMTVIYPAKLGGGENDCSGDALESLLSLRQRDNFGRTQVPVEGYFQDGDDDPFNLLIPNDLPRSTILYVLTASEGRDKLFKCLQYGLHVMICFLKRPTLFSADSQVFADYWAERFWRNSNTIRHGRSLFKLGRWVLNLFYLEEVLERLSLKHGFMIKNVLDNLIAPLAHLLHLPSKSSLLRYKGKKSARISDNSIDASGNNNTDTLVTDDMYSYVARAELPWKRQGINPSRGKQNDNMRQGNVMNTKDSTESQVVESTAAHRFYVKDKVNNSITETMTKLNRNAERVIDASEGDDINPTLTKEDSSRNEGLSSPPSIQSTLPASLILEGGRYQSTRPKPNSAVQLLRPLHASEENNNNNNNGPHEMNIGSFAQKPLDKEGNPSAVTEALGTPSRYLTSFPTLPYETRLGDALTSPKSNNNNGQQQSDNGGSKSQLNRFISPSEMNIEEDGEALQIRHTTFNDSDVSLSSSGVADGSKHSDTGNNNNNNTNNGKQSIPAEMGLPANCRKRIFQFSTPLMLLLGVRSVATIGRRVLRDILLLSSEHFFNLSYVEKNRPSLQRRTNWMWLVVACIDLLLNTIRLSHSGWYKFAAARHSTQYSCNCCDREETNLLTRYRDLIAKRRANLFFPPVDFDFGAPICSSPAYFEAADPDRIAPACRICGCLFVKSHNEENEDVSHSNNNNNNSDDNNNNNNSEGGGGGVGGNNVNDMNQKRKNSNNNNNTNGRSYESNPTHVGAHLTSITEKTEVAVLFIPWLMRKLFNYVWLLRTHPNWTATLLLQIRYMVEVYLAFKYCLGGYETGKSDAPLSEMLHPSGAIAGLIGAIIGLHRVVESAPQ